MNPELDDALCARWTLIFAQRHGDRAHTAMARGFQCPDHWFAVIDGLCAALQWETDHAGAPQVVATQVKEQFGSLRFHTRQASNHQRAMILAASHISERLGAQLRVMQMHCTPHQSS